ncbi:CLUMA_CG004298, isoform A [Clunio marinus]|uniref:CLUMA_CG004298, isoform A n=1 Tax=Clunio marinus TaxID=568069 RepID=A0A1J1HT93_9DIPT|nr:CLUMA_CG004298, isoform A [Clunio marinus]
MESENVGTVDVIKVVLEMLSKAARQLKIAPNGEICSRYGYFKCGIFDCKINKFETIPALETVVNT